VRNLNRSGLLTTLARELAKYKLHLVHMQVKGSNVRTGDYTFFYGKGNENHPVRTGVFVSQEKVSGANKVNFLVMGCQI
jgi:hypothetical protein